MRSIHARAKSSDPRTDLELLMAWREGDTDAAGVLVARHEAGLRQYYRRRLGTQLHEDAVQHTWLVMACAIHRFEGRSSVAGYLYGIAGNCVREARRRSARELRVPSTACSVEDPRPGPADVLEVRERQLQLAAAMERLPEEPRRLLELHYWEQQSASQIGRALGLGEPTARSRIRRATTRVRRSLSSASVPASAPRAATATAPSSPRRAGPRTAW